MTLDHAHKLIRGCADSMDALYRRQVFDEWAIISLIGGRGRIHSYDGPRRDGFQQDFNKDAESIGTQLLKQNHSIGDFDFSRTGSGTRFDALMVLGEGLFLICNNTKASMATIVKEREWLRAQVPFVELSEKFRSSPLVLPL